MLKKTGLFYKLAPSKNNGNKSVFNKNNNSRPAFEKNNSNDEVNGFSIGRNYVEYNKLLRKLSKSRKSKSKKTSKS